ncbi:MAG: CDP-archaeol synthase [Euryarchaeota archaeon]|jgi:CDP-2,3-bis-(O-geranylgeranyl)-sn-glycerol synthase|nr:CDP-archaeol synthase [Euryarchaeota archaeon]MBT4803263.1 CDP-archaeol synthase [Euryarchaeota archaeon]MBT5613683.1 CDP-archaeol synthase [Euryarchaeota archaeon]MBT6683543.1 CDP-archaeol synthase [Euryarchaeota archaeon]MBT6874349.1 CDP-archaeol synthase [Euryarchaeota archaeon]
MFALEFALDIVTILLLYGPAYLANTGAMLFGKWIPELTKTKTLTIDGGRSWSDGNRILGDGKSWNGLFGGAFFSGILMTLSHIIWNDNSIDSNKLFLDPLAMSDSSDWFWLYNDHLTAFFLGCTLGFFCLFGDSLGSFFKRRKGLKREGIVSSKAPILDTMPFAICIFLSSFALFPNQVFTQNFFIFPILILLVLTPIIHRLTNILGFKLGLKDVPY